MTMIQFWCGFFRLIKVSIPLGVLYLLIITEFLPLAWAAMPILYFIFRMVFGIFAFGFLYHELEKGSNPNNYLFSSTGVNMPEKVSKLEKGVN